MTREKEKHLSVFEFLKLCFSEFVHVHILTFLVMCIKVFCVHIIFFMFEFFEFVFVFTLCFLHVN